MNSFKNLPSMTPPSKANAPWTVNEDWRTPIINGISIEILAGMTTDGASIPRVAWRLIGHPFQVPLLGPALGHDALYAAELIPRNEADEWFLEAMKKAGIGWAKRNAIWLAVRSGGWTVWNKHTGRSIAKSRMFARIL